mmetsp:Transcript_25561/g.28429  ORF Transcript_25561/g.28429 Transcript_25561/m.28429 type:complete len:153 (+) Transcript_25561:517-975(+)
MAPLQWVDISPKGDAATTVNNKGELIVYRGVATSLVGMKESTTISAHGTYALKCKFSPNAAFVVTTGADHLAKIWNTKGMIPEKTLKGHEKWVWDCAFTSDSAYLLTTSSDKSALLWDLNSGKTVNKYSGHQRAVTAVALDDVDRPPRKPSK